MTLAMETLYQYYAQEETVRLFLAQVRSYTMDVCHVEEYANALRALLDEDGQALLDKLLRTKDNVSEAESGAMFQAGVHAAFELILL